MPGVRAAAKVAGKASPLPDAASHAAKLKGQGASPAQVTKALGDMGYPAQTPPATPAPAPAAAANPRPAPARPAPTSSGAGGSGGIAGFALGLVGTAVLINFMRGGPSQVGRWAKAKFLNEATGTPGDTFPRGGSNAPKLGKDPATGSNIPAAATTATGGAFWGQW